MASRLVSVLVDAGNPARLAEFWCGVLGWHVTASGWQATPSGLSGVTISSSGGARIELGFCWVPEVKTHKNRIHLDVNPTDRDQAAELDRLLLLGATPVDVGQRRVTWHVLADLEGNEFCLCRDCVAPDG
jgi:hypothetical protein